MLSPWLYGLHLEPEFNKGLCKTLKRPMFFFHLARTIRGGFLAFIFQDVGDPSPCMDPSCMHTARGVMVGHEGG